MPLQLAIFYPEVPFTQRVLEANRDWNESAHRNRVSRWLGYRAAAVAVAGFSLLDAIGEVAISILILAKTYCPKAFDKLELSQRVTSKTTSGHLFEAGRHLLGAITALFLGAIAPKGVFLPAMHRLGLYHRESAFSKRALCATVGLVGLTLAVYAYGPALLVQKIVTAFPSTAAVLGPRVTPLQWSENRGLIRAAAVVGIVVLMRWWGPPPPPSSPPSASVLLPAKAPAILPCGGSDDDNNWHFHFPGASSTRGFGTDRYAYTRQADTGQSTGQPDAPQPPHAYARQADTRHSTRQPDADAGRSTGKPDAAPWEQHSGSSKTKQKSKRSSDNTSKGPTPTLSDVLRSITNTVQAVGYAWTTTEALLEDIAELGRRKDQSPQGLAREALLRAELKKRSIVWDTWLQGIYLKEEQCSTIKIIDAKGHTWSLEDYTKLTPQTLFYRVLYINGRPLDTDFNTGTVTLNESQKKSVTSRIRELRRYS